MPKATTNKKKPTSKVGGGGVNTKKSKLNLKLVIPIVLVVAALGGFYIFKKSSAATAHGLIGSGVLKKYDGRMYQIDSYGAVRTSQHIYLARSNQKICAEVMAVGSSAVSVRAGALLKWGGTGLDYRSREIHGNPVRIPSGSVDVVCAGIPDDIKNLLNNGETVRFLGRVNGDKGFGVYSIYPR